MTIPTEPIGSIPRPLPLIDAVAAAVDRSDAGLGYRYDEAIRDTITRFEATERCLDRGAHSVQSDLTEERLAIEIDPTGSLLDCFINLNHLALSRFSPTTSRETAFAKSRARVLGTALAAKTLSNR